jgi:hypothetical protein
MFVENDLSRQGVRMVRFAGLRRAVFRGGLTGDDGAEMWREVSTTEAVEMAGRDDAGAGMLRVRFFRLRALRLGESGRRGLGICGNGIDSVSRSSSPCASKLLLLLLACGWGWWCLFLFS